MGKNGAVVSNHPVATQAGLDVLRAGGNATDAAVAMSLLLGVVEPFMSGLGGDGFYQTFEGKTGRGLVFNGTGPAPMAWGNKEQASLPHAGPLSATIPGSLGAVWAMHAETGRMPWAELVAPAVRVAEGGYGATFNFVRFTSTQLDKVRSNAVTARNFLRDGAAPSVGAWMQFPELATTLQAIADDGADALYRGSLSQRFMQDCEETGLNFVAEEMASFAPEVLAPISTTYRGFEVRQTPPNSTGFTFLQALKIVEQVDPKELVPLCAESTHLLIEAKKLAFQDRERYGGDPRRRALPMDALLSTEHAAALATEIDMTKAALRPVESHQADTTYFCAVDKHGNAVSAIQSLNNAFGSAVTLPRTGILMNNRMNCWHTEAGHANRLEGGRRVRHTMNAPLVLKDGRVWAVFGTPGGDDQVQINLQMAVGLMNADCDPQSLVEMPRWNSSQPGQHFNWPHLGSDELSLEEDFPQEAIDALRAKGHKVKLVPALNGPCSVGCIRVLEDGVLVGAADPRRDGWAAAF